MKFNRPIILASKSPRRSQLLREMGFEFEVKTMDIEESYPSSLKTEDIAAFLAEKKAKGSKSLITGNEVLITADTIVALGDIIFGKPQNYDHAFQMIRKLSGKKHQVITGVCIMTKSQNFVFSDIAHVYFDELTDAEIDYYITNYKPYDKAGSYAIQEWIGLTKIKKIEGSYFTIMGLPTHLVYKQLLSLNVF